MYRCALPVSNLCFVLPFPQPYLAVLSDTLSSPLLTRVLPSSGACMARDNTGATGVTNHAGEVFTGNGSDTYQGLIVTDGAIVPAALGANPFATIAALAERSLEHYVAKNNLKISQDKNGILDLFGEPQHKPTIVMAGPAP